MLARRSLVPALALPALLGALPSAFNGAPAAAQAPAATPPATPPATPAVAPVLVEKKLFEAGEHRTRGGAVVRNMRVGYQTAGTLDAAGGNAVLLCHFFSGTGHAFGRYEAGGPAGWWDAIVGPGKPIDTERYFVVAADTPVNLSARDARVFTTGPASVDPSSGRPYGMGFPVLSIRDFVEVQKRLLDSLGVRRLALVGGPSMGALQSIEWAAAYPEMVERVLAAVPTGVMDSYLQGWMEVWEAPIRLDPNWRGGDYYTQGREPPLRGLTDALRIVSLQAGDRGALARFDRAPLEGQDPARRRDDQFAVERFLDEAALARARNSDANSFLFLTRANQLFLNEYPDTASALARSRARWLVVPSLRDRVFPVEYGRELFEALRAAGREAVLAELTGPLGHLEGVVGMAAVAEQVRALLAAPPGAG